MQHELSVSQHPRLGSRIHQQDEVGKLALGLSLLSSPCQRQLSDSRHASDLPSEQRRQCVSASRSCFEGSGLSFLCLPLPCASHSTFHSSARTPRVAPLACRERELHNKPEATSTSNLVLLVTGLLYQPYASCNSAARARQVFQRRSHHVAPIHCLRPKTC